MTDKIKTLPYVPNLSSPLLYNKVIGLDIIPVELISTEEAKSKNLYTNILIRDSVKGISSIIPKGRKVTDYSGTLDLCSLPGFKSKFGLSWEGRVLNGKLMGVRKPYLPSINYIFSKVTSEVGKLTNYSSYRTDCYYVYESPGNVQRGSHLQEIYDPSDSYSVISIQPYRTEQVRMQVYIGREGTTLPKKILLLSIESVEEFIKVVKPVNKFKRHLRSRFIAHCIDTNNTPTGLLLTLHTASL